MAHLKLFLLGQPWLKRGGGPIELTISKWRAFQTGG